MMSFGRHSAAIKREAGSKIPLRHRRLAEKGANGMHDGGRRNIYIDVSDVVQFLKHSVTVSGIQRVQLEVVAALAALDDGHYDIRVCLADDSIPGFDEFPLSHLLQMRAIVEQESAPRAALNAMIDLIHREKRPARMQAGDVCFVGGAFWLFRSTASKMRSLSQSGVLVGFQCYDLIPIYNSEYCSEELSFRFKRTMDPMIRWTHFALTISAYVETQLRAYAVERGITDLKTKAVLLAHDFAKPTGALATAPVAGDNVGVDDDVFGLAGRPYVLFVSTIEPRKNHNYTFLLWQRLIQEFGADCPTLVWAGREGWLVGDLMERARRTDYLGGCLKIITDASDADLVRLYRDCAFTIYPSFAEGYGLPVAESLIFGKPCIASGATSIPEVGGDFVTYVDPYNISEGVDVVRRWLLDPAVPRSAETRIRHEFSPRRWSDVARDMMLAIHLFDRDIGIETRASSLVERSDRLRMLRRDGSGPPPDKDAAELWDIEHDTDGDANWTARGGSRTGPVVARRPQQLIALRVQGAGRLIQSFGADWESEGFFAACRGLGREMSFFLTFRSRLITRALRRKLESFGFGGDGPAGQGQEPAILPPPVPSVLLIGYINADLGLGESLRGLAGALSLGDIDFAIYPFGSGMDGDDDPARRRSVAFMPSRYDIETPRAVNVIEVAANELPTVLANLPARHFDRSYNVLRTYWELGEAPSSWRAPLTRVHELWVPNAFVARSFRPIFDGPIVIVPPCVDVSSPSNASRQDFALEEDRFYFLFSFDFFSFPERKNPLAVLRAFQEAFAKSSAPVGLVLKSTGVRSRYPEIRRHLADAARDDPRIRVIDKTLSRPDMLALLDAADCYVSLHRSEGFGLGMAEAMAFGKPVIGTNYSGNTDFLRDDTGYPVAFKMIPVEPGHYVHAEGQMWAEPSEVACARAMLEVYDNRPEAVRRAERGRRLIGERYGSANVARLVDGRLREILAMREEASSR